MEPMMDEPKDMWATATVLFELLISGFPDWERQHGPFMFGPSKTDLLEGAKLQDTDEQRAFSIGKTQAGHELWVRPCLRLPSVTCSAQCRH